MGKAFSSLSFQRGKFSSFSKEFMKVTGGGEPENNVVYRLNIRIKIPIVSKVPPKDSNFPGRFMKFEYFE